MSDFDYNENEQPLVTSSAPVGFNFADLMVDDTLSREGVWVDFYGGSRLKIASTNSSAYKSKLQRITAEALATTVLLDWEGIHWPNADGTVTHNVAYTPKLGMEALRVDKFREFVLDEASRVSNFKRELTDAAKKP